VHYHFVLLHRLLQNLLDLLLGLNAGPTSRSPWLRSITGDGRLNLDTSDSPTPEKAAQPTRFAPAGSARAAVHPDLGVVALNGPAIRDITDRLRERILKDPQLKARFYDNPRAVLASAGLNDEIQAEILRVDRDFGGSPFVGGGRLEDWCITTSCCCTGCCATCWITF
jgi:hypothetical protein